MTNKDKLLQEINHLEYNIEQGKRFATLGYNVEGLLTLTKTLLDKKYIELKDKHFIELCSKYYVEG